MNPRIHHFQSGLSLIELMIGLTLSLFLLLGVGQLFISTKQTYQTTDGLSRTQENGRFAIEFLSRDLRQAGFKGGCIGPVNNLLDPTGPGYSADLFDLEGGIIGWNNAAGTHAARMTGYQAGTDAILVKHAANPSGATASGNTPANANTINLLAKSNIPAGTIVVVADSSGCDIFQNRSNASASNLTRGNTGEPGNLNPGTNNFSKAYDSSMEILSFTSALYYIGTGANGLPSLRRVVFNQGNTTTNEELVEGVLTLQILYGVDNDSNLEVDVYRTADLVTNWSNVVSVQICLITMSTEANVATGAIAPPCHGTPINVPDNRIAQAFTTTIGLRNRLP